MSESANKPSIKTASKKSPARGRQPVSYPDVLRVLEGAKERSLAMAGFAARGGDRDRWHEADRAAMAGALTHVEDWLEYNRPRFDRATIREVRRKLEEAVR